jgi:glycosyltransferase involved in cell wall biosynthesis
MRPGISGRAKLKILIITFNFAPQIGGVADIASTQASGFLARGHEVCVATEFNAARQNQDCPKGVCLQQFKIGNSLADAHADPFELKAYQQYILNGGWDAILVNCWQNRATDIALPLLRDVRATKILASQGFNAHLWRPYPRPFWGIGSWLRWQPYVWRLPKRMKLFDQLVFVGKRRNGGMFFDHLVARRVVPSRVSVIPNGVHLSRVARSRTRFREAYAITSRHVVLNVATYSSRKNQLATLNDFMRLNRPDSTLVFIGADFNEYQAAMARTYEAERRRFPCARVLFLEKIPKELIYAAYAASDVFVLSSKSEAQPLAILDGMASGVPFVSTNVGCVSELPGGLIRRSGWATTNALRSLLDDPELRRKLGEEGRHACERKYNWERVLDSYEELFVQLGGPSHPERRAARGANARLR